MKRKLLLFLVLPLLGLSACGGGSGPSTPGSTSPSVTSVSGPRPVHIRSNRGHEAKLGIQVVTGHRHP